jgi:SPASM domain peptide maturase of grasp-with-spasm system
MASDFFAALNDWAREQVPVTFRTATAIEPEAVAPSRLAESARHRSRAFECVDFGKPISRCFTRPPRDAAPSGAAAGAPAGAVAPGAAPPSDAPRPAHDDDVFLLYACCVAVAGARRGSICDLQRMEVQLIPSGLCEILKAHRGKTVRQIKDAYGREYDQEIDDYFAFLVDRQLGFWSAEPQLFPEIDLTWRSPHQITNAIVDVDARSEHDFGAILRDLDDLGCNALELRCFDTGALPRVREVLLAAQSTGLRAIELLVPYAGEAAENGYRELCREFPRISRISVHSAPHDRRTEAGVRVSVVYRRDVVDGAACCGQVHPGYFLFTLQSFIEAQSHNSCLNRKIAVDARGEIRNCPSLPRSYGNVREVSLHAALAQRDFRDLWSINKDQIAVCRDCELRYVCTDCRAYVTSADDRFAKPAKCSYDPYTARWGGA